MLNKDVLKEFIFELEQTHIWLSDTVSFPVAKRKKACTRGDGTYFEKGWGEGDC